MPKDDGSKGGRKKSEPPRERTGFKASRPGAGKRSSAAGNKSEQKRAAEERERGGPPATKKAAGSETRTSHEKSRFL